MEIKIEKIDDTTYTIFKISKKERNCTIEQILNSFNFKPFRKSSIYNWYKVEGDLLNMKKDDL